MVVNTTAVAVLLITFFALILLRVNIAFAVGAASTLCLMYLGMPLSNVCQQMVKGLNSFSLMAVPFFITMGCLMGTGGISEKLIAWLDGCAGEWPWLILWHLISSEVYQVRQQLIPHRWVIF